jgi:hypothetical protein
MLYVILSRTSDMSLLSVLVDPYFALLPPFTLTSPLYTITIHASTCLLHRYKSRCRSLARLTGSSQIRTTATP